MGVEKALADGVRIFIGVGVAMMGAVITSPPTDGSFDCTSTHGGKEDPERNGSRVGGMCPQPMVARGDTKPSSEVVGNGPDGSLPIQRSPEGENGTEQWYSDNQSHVQPIDMLVPVGSRYGRVGYVSFVGSVGG